MTISRRMDLAIAAFGLTFGLTYLIAGGRFWPGIFMLVVSAALALPRRD